MRALEIAIRSLPTRAPWPEVDEEGWWREVLADRPLRRSAAKSLSDKGRGCRPTARPSARQVAHVFLRMVRSARHGESRRANRDVRARTECALDRAARPQMSGPALAPRGRGVSDYFFRRSSPQARHRGREAPAAGRLVLPGALRADQADCVGTQLRCNPIRRKRAKPENTESQCC